MVNYNLSFLLQTIFVPTKCSSAVKTMPCTRSSKNDTQTGQPIRSSPSPTGQRSRGSTLVECSDSTSEQTKSDDQKIEVSDSSETQPVKDKSSEQPASEKKDISLITSTATPVSGRTTDYRGHSPDYCQLSACYWL